MNKTIKTSMSLAAILFTVTAESNAAALTGVYDFEGNANDGVGSNDLTLNTGSSLATVDGRNALSISTSAGNASVATPDSNLSIPTAGADDGKFSIAMWMNYNSSTDQYARAITRSYSGGAYNIAFGSGNAATSTLAFRVNDPGFTTLSTTLTISRDTWHHVAFSFDNGTVTGWIDGVAETTFTNGGGSIQGGDPFVLGAGNSGSGFAGAFDDVSFFHGVLSQSEVDGLIAGVPEPSTTALLGLGGLALILRRRK
jgi:arabinan endo-1,5-alpha-L-arabinosidase